VEVEAIGHVRHKNLVRLLGYCIEGTHRYTIFFLPQMMLYSLELRSFAHTIHFGLYALGINSLSIERFCFVA
jgi:hypothetical protein